MRTLRQDPQARPAAGAAAKAWTTEINRAERRSASQQSPNTPLAQDIVPRVVSVRPAGSPAPPREVRKRQRAHGLLAAAGSLTWARPSVAGPRRSS